MERIILHSDINNCFASIEAALDPSLKGKPIAVCGNQEERHGIVLAKSEQAKKYGVYTGQTAYQAKQICPELLIVSPHFDEYLRFSHMAQQLYFQFTDQVEPFGLDECWLDVTGSTGLFGSGEQIAQLISQRMKKELGVTVSIGVSFNKIFAKLGSDIKKPDAITVISKQNYKNIVWRLPIRYMLGIGRSTGNALNKKGIFTIGDIAAAGADRMLSYLGKNGLKLWVAASGLDSSRVLKMGESPTVKSVSSGVTAVADMVDAQDSSGVLLTLCADVSRHLRDAELWARGVQLAVRSNDLNWRQYQMHTDYPLQSLSGIYACVTELLKNYTWEIPVRSFSVRAIELCCGEGALQQDMLGNAQRHEKRERADKAMYMVNKKYGKNSVAVAGMLLNSKMPQGDRINCLPGAHNVST